MEVNLPAGRNRHRLGAVQGKKYWVDGVPVGVIIGHIDTGMNTYLTVEVDEMADFNQIKENFDIFARHER